jgi:hypothetical protein
MPHLPKDRPVDKGQAFAAPAGVIGGGFDADVIPGLVVLLDGGLHGIETIREKDTDARFLWWRVS